MQGVGVALRLEHVRRRVRGIAEAYVASAYLLPGSPETSPKRRFERTAADLPWGVSINSSEQRSHR